MTDSIASPTSGIVYGEIGMTTLYSRYEAAYDLVLHMDVNHLDIQNSAGYMNLNTEPETCRGGCSISHPKQI